MSGIKYFLTHYEIVCASNGKRQQVVSDADTFSLAQDDAKELARKTGLSIINLAWREQFPKTPNDAIYVCEIRRDMTLSNTPRVFA